MKGGRPRFSAEDGKIFCPYCKEFDKTSRSKFISGCDSMRIENVHSHETSNAERTSHSALNSKRPPVGHLMNALIIIEKHNINLMKKNSSQLHIFLTKDEKPYTDFVKPTELQAANYGDDILTKHYNNDKQTNEFQS